MFAGKVADFLFCGIGDEVVVRPFILLITSAKFVILLSYTIYVYFFWGLNLIVFIESEGPMDKADSYLPSSWLWLDSLIDSILWCLYCLSSTCLERMLSIFFWFSITLFRTFSAFNSTIYSLKSYISATFDWILGSIYLLFVFASWILNDFKLLSWALTIAFYLLVSRFFF